mmetsp:Transcript_8329/g.12619  ORF Transcript_8329/g.12619 Transcript_8329/m.12619 type:complete len:195 (+) Transcript_8329:270-854(+)
MIASGIGYHNSVMDTSVEEMARVTPTLMHVNVVGPMLLLRACLPLMLAKHPDRKIQPKVVLMSSISGYFGLPSRSMYCASKFALNGFVETLALELKDAQAPLQIFLVCPTTVQTKFRSNWRQHFGAADTQTSPPSSGVSVEACVDTIWHAFTATTSAGLHRLFIPGSAKLGYTLVRLPGIGNLVEGYIATRAKL